MTPKPLGFQADDRYRTVIEGRIVDMYHFAGWALDRQSIGPEAARHALDGWREIGLPFRKDASGERHYDPVEVLNFVKQAGLDGEDGFWRDRLVNTARRLPLTLPAEPRRFEVTLKRSFHIRAEPGQTLRLRMSLPLESDHLSGLTVAPFADTEARLNATRGRLEARLPAIAKTVTIGAELGFNAGPRQADGSPPPDPVYLKPRDGMIIITGRVAALAERLAGPGTPPLKAVRAFWDFCLDEFRQSGVHYDQVDWAAPGDWLLDNGWGDCQLVGALFCALCRARDIPARLLGGHYLYAACPSNHFWAEAWVGGLGWMPFDFLCWELSAGGQDGDWRDYFFGRLDARLTNQCLPFDFTGATGVPLPRAWHISVWAPRLDEVEIEMSDIDARPLYTDVISVK